MAGYKRRPTKPRESFTRILTEIENQMWQSADLNSLWF
jgi:hypothetical protein